MKPVYARPAILLPHAAIVTVAALAAVDCAGLRPAQPPQGVAAIVQQLFSPPATGTVDQEVWDSALRLMEVGRAETAGDEEGGADSDPEDMSFLRSAVEISDPTILFDRPIGEIRPPSLAPIPLAEHLDDERVQNWIRYFTENPKGRQWYAETLTRSNEVIGMMYEALEAEGMPKELIYLAMIESGFKNTAYSHAHASGIWQFIPSTGRIYGLRIDDWVDQRRDPYLATRSALRLLKDLYIVFQDWHLAMSAYNSGSRRVARAIRKGHTRDYWKLSHRRLLPRETRNYVPKLIAAWYVSQDPSRWDLPAANGPMLMMSPAAVTVPAGTSVEAIARAANTPTEEFLRMNLGLRRMATPPNEDMAVYIPAAESAGFHDRLWAMAETQRDGLQPYTVRNGQTLTAIANEYAISQREILRLNGLDSDARLAPGMTLRLPIPKGTAPAEARTRATRTTHRVRSGETLSAIARKYRTSVAKLRKINNLGKRSLIRPGQRLNIDQPAWKVRAETDIYREQRAAAAAATVMESGSDTYIIQPGDTLYSIARQREVVLDDLLRANSMTRDATIQPGQKIVVPRPPPSPTL